MVHWIFLMEFVDSVLDHHICGFEWPNLHFFFSFFWVGVLRLNSVLSFGDVEV